MTLASIAVAVATELFDRSNDAVALLGARCSCCGSYYFPTTTTCRNSQCAHPNVESTRLGQRGWLYSWTTQIYRPPPPFRMDPWEPYLIGLVELPEGLRVLSMLCGCDAADIAIGIEVKLTTRRLYRDDEGRDVVTYAYRPSRGSAS